jgi:dihydrofolate synthase / folylpolyglutamate synthase
VLAEMAKGMGLTVETAADVPQALARVAAYGGAGPRRVLICGSLYLAGHVLALNDGLPGVEA